MRYLACLLFLAFAGCKNSSNEKTKNADSISSEKTEMPVSDTLKPDPEAINVQPTVDSPKTKPPSSESTYSNQRFKDVTVQKTGEHTFRIKGKGQIFEASFGWVVEDGHNELKQGFEMTDAGAPEWGKFNFTVDVKKQRENSTLTLILFETSAKDGSRQHQLPIKLY